MANTTVYPYGTGGSLPSSVGIINDLKTGGADKALAAEQGVVLKNMINGEYYVSPYVGERLKRVITSSNVWSSSGNNNDSVQLTVTSGQEYRIKGNASSTTYYAFLTSYSDGSSAPSFASGYASLFSISAGGNVEITIPSDCNILYIGIKSSGTIQAPQELIFLERAVEKVSEDLSRLRGEFNEMVDFNQVTVSSSDSSYISIAKDDNGGILITNITKASSKMAYISLPSSLVPGEKYELSFRYRACFNYSDSWFLRFVTSSYGEVELGVSLYPTASDISNYSTAKLTFIYDASYAYLRLAGNSQNTGATVYIIDYSISNNKTDVASLAERVYNLENDVDTSDGYAYEGEKIVVNPNYKYSLQLLATNSIQAQTAALYEKYLFIIKDKFTTVLLYNMETMSQVYTWNTGQSVDTWHCNQASFGIDKVESSDMFPVLYISQQPDPDSTRGIVQAYRIIPTLSGETITSFTMVLAQTINLPAMTSQNALGYPNAAIDTEKRAMWTYSRDTSSGGNGLATFTKFAIPSLSSATVTLEDSNILDSFQEKWKIYSNQGAFIHKGKMYMMRGVPSFDQFIECNVIDLYFTRTRVSRVELYANGFTYEPQGCFYYNNTVCFTTNNNRMYQINF